MLSGYFAGSVGLLVGHPLDSLKVLLQTQMDGLPAQRGATPGAPPPSAAAAEAAAKAAAQTVSATPPPAASRGALATMFPPGISPFQRIRNLYSGIATPLVTVGIVQSLNFAMYDSARRVIYNFEEQLGRHPPQKPNAPPRSYLTSDSLLGVSAASAIAGCVISLITSPFSIIKTVQQVQPGVSFGEVIRKTYRPSNPNKRCSVRNFYVGYPAHLYCEGPGRAVYFVTYEYLKRWQTEDELWASVLPESMLKLSREPGSAPVVYGSRTSLDCTLGERMIAAALSGILCWISIFPFDVVRSKVAVHSAQFPYATSTPSTLEMSRELYKKGGIRPFFRGLTLTVLRAGPVAATTLPAYDFMFAYLMAQDA